ncbi:MAG: putative 2OG-Fe(II) oxygenase [Rhodospirillaceae bacterium]
MNAPHLRMTGNLSAGSTERIRPKAGRLVMFPSWVFHQVRPYHGGAERISIAFNLTV